MGNAIMASVCFSISLYLTINNLMFLAIAIGIIGVVLVFKSKLPIENEELKDFDEFKED